VCVVSRFPKLAVIFEAQNRGILPAEGFQCRLSDVVGWHDNVSGIVRTTPREYWQWTVVGFPVL